MEDKKQLRINIVTVFLIIAIVIIVIMGFITYKLVVDKKQSDNEVSNLQTESQTIKETLGNVQNELNNVNIASNNKSEETKNNLTTDSKTQVNATKEVAIKGLYDIINANDSEAVKAQKIAKEFANDVNNKDWYTVSKFISWGADNYIKYGIYNYQIDSNNYQHIGNEYVFTEKYDWDKSKLSSLGDEGLGRIFIVEFKDGGSIAVSSLCTGY